jgi:hypothetical protein
MLEVFLPMITVVPVELGEMTGIDSEPVKGIQKNIEYELDSRFFLDFGVDFAFKRNWDGSAILDCKSQLKVHLLVSYNH